MALLSETKIETIIFDLGAVLIDWNPAYLYRKIFSSEDDIQYFLTEICSPEWNAEQDGGRSWATATELLISRYPDYAKQIRAYWKRWPEMINGPITGSVEILREIHQQQQYRLLALTNWSAETWPYAWEQYQFLQLFEGIVVSGKEQMKKPDSRIYDLLGNRFQVPRESALFIDDSIDNVQSAREFGWQAIRFQSPRQLRTELEHTGVLAAGARANGST